MQLCPVTRASAFAAGQLRGEKPRGPAQRRSGMRLIRLRPCCARPSPSVCSRLLTSIFEMLIAVFRARQVDLEPGLHVAGARDPGPARERQDHALPQGHRRGLGARPTQPAAGRCARKLQTLAQGRAHNLARQKLKTEDGTSLRCTGAGHSASSSTSLKPSGISSHKDAQRCHETMTKVRVD